MSDKFKILLLSIAGVLGGFVNGSSVPFMALCFAAKKRTRNCFTYYFARQYCQRSCIFN